MITKPDYNIEYNTKVREIAETLAAKNNKFTYERFSKRKTGVLYVKRWEDCVQREEETAREIVEKIAKEVSWALSINYSQEAIKQYLIKSGLTPEKEEVECDHNALYHLGHAQCIYCGESLPQTK